MRKLTLSLAAVALTAAGASAQCGPAGCPVPPARTFAANVASAPVRLAAFVGGAVARPAARGFAPQRTGPVRRLVARVRGR